MVRLPDAASRRSVSLSLIDGPCSHAHGIGLMFLACRLDSSIVVPRLTPLHVTTTGSYAGEGNASTVEVERP